MKADEHLCLYWRASRVHIGTEASREHSEATDGNALLQEHAETAATSANDLRKKSIDRRGGIRRTRTICGCAPPARGRTVRGSRITRTLRLVFSLGKIQSRTSGKTLPTTVQQTSKNKTVGGHYFVVSEHTPCLHEKGWTTVAEDTGRCFRGEAEQQTVCSMLRQKKNT